MLVDVGIKSSFAVCGLCNSEIDSQRPGEYRKRKRDQDRRRQQEAKPGRRHQALAIEQYLVTGGNDHRKPGKHNEGCDAVERPKSTACKCDDDCQQRRRERKKENETSRKWVHWVAFDLGCAFARMARPSTR